MLGGRAIPGAKLRFLSLELSQTVWPVEVCYRKRQEGRKAGRQVTRVYISRMRGATPVGVFESNLASVFVLQKNQTFKVSPL